MEVGHVVYDLNDGRFRLEPLADTREEDSIHTLLRSAVGGNILSTELKVRWSPSHSRGLVIDLESEMVGIYDSEHHRIIRVSADAEVRAKLYVAHRWDWATWDAYWRGDDMAALVPRAVNGSNFGTLLIDARSGVVRAFDFGSINTWACLLAGAWDPSGELFQLTLSRTTRDDIGDPYEGDWYWIDGSASVSNTVWQHVIIQRNGTDARAVRAIGYGPEAAAENIAAWSLDGDWLAFGGHRERRRCGFRE